MARRSHQILSAAVAGGCLALCACGSGSPAGGSAAGGGTNARSGASELTARFCDKASSFMRQIPAAPATSHMSTALARDNLRKVLRATVDGFSQLETTAPSRLRQPLSVIVGVYKSDEKALKTSGSLAEISQAMVRGNATGSAAFQQVLRYISASCK